MPNASFEFPRFGRPRRTPAIASASAFLIVLTQAALAATITVTGVGDTVAFDGSITLREAITSINNGANVNADVVAIGAYGTSDTINFNIAGAGVKTISPASALPTITKPVVINGYSQPGTSLNTLANSDNAVLLIQLNGSTAGAGANGLTLGAGSTSSTIKGFVINRFAGHGIVVQSNFNTIVGNFIGVDTTGTARSPNGTFPTTGDGIRVQNVSNNVIGGFAVADRNILSGNALCGVHIIGTLAAPAVGNVIRGNFVGVGKDGVSGVGNRTEPAPAPGTPEGNNLYGIEISGGTQTAVGGAVAGGRNVIGFNGAGIVLDNGAQQNTIQGNFIGVGADGVTATANLLHGIAVRSSNGFSAPLGPAQANEPGSSFNIIGGVAAGNGNLIQQNGTGGVAIFGNPVSASGQANVGNIIQGNSIFKNGRSTTNIPLVGIDLTNGFVYPQDDGVTPNDSKGHGAANDPNNFQNSPILTAATSSGTTTNIAGTLNSPANSAYRIEFFASDPDPLKLPPEGQQFLGFVNVNTNGNGTVSFNTSMNVAVAAGRFITATATDPGGNTSEFSAGILVTPQALNISTRLLVQGGNNVLIAGFIVTGSVQKTVAIRGIGPSLSQFFSGTLADPTLELHSGNVTLVTNDNWQDDQTQAQQLSSHNLAPSDPKESGIVATLPAQASYTAILAGKNGGTGIGVAEIYDLNQSASSELANISSRGFVLTGDNVMIGGFILGGNGSSTRIAVRGLGPSLAQFGLNPVLANPTLELHDSNGAVLASNDNWQDDSAQADLLTNNGLALSDPNESGIFISPPPGQFTAILAGKNGGTGIGTVEIYNLH